jgi:hypothetical protein
LPLNANTLRAMRWHNDALRIAGRSPSPLATAEAGVQALEARLGFTLPAALRELLVTDIWPEFLHEFSNCGEPLTVAEMGTAKVQWRNYDVRAAGILPFMRENQHVCTWALPLNLGDDPPVLVEVDSGDPPNWQTAAATFSMWVRCQVEDRLLLKRAMFAAQAEPLSESSRAALSERFALGQPTSAWPAREVLRLHGDLGDLLLWNADDQCDWWIAPRDLAHAERLLDVLPVSAEMRSLLYDLKPEAKSVLDAWRLRFTSE